MLYKLAALALVALLGAPLTATAIPVTYQIKFTVLTGNVVTFFPHTTTSIHVESAVGNVYFGLFAVDDAILLTDGINKPGNVDFFYTQMEDNIWGYNLAVNNSFRGFWGPISGYPFTPGFDVVNGTITNLRGGVYGVQDAPFIDFSAFGPNTFRARGLDLLLSGPSITIVGYGEGGEPITGTMEIFRVPEPGALSLFGFGLLVLTFSMRRTAGRLAPPH